MVNSLALLGFTLVAAYWPWHWFTQRRIGRTADAARFAHVQKLHQVCTAAGTALMFAAML